MPSSRAVAAAVAVALGTLLLLSLASPAQAKGSFAHARARRSLAQLEEAGGAGDLASQANETTEVRTESNRSPSLYSLKPSLPFAFAQKSEKTRSQRQKRPATDGNKWVG